MMGEAATESTQELCRYIRDTWMTDGLWAPQAWCVFRKSIRTNNDVEGWHHALNKEAGAKSPFYLLLDVLHDAAKFVQVQVLLVSEGKLRRLRRRRMQTLEARLFRYWGEFEDGARSTDRLLRACARLLGNMDASMDV
ncbi:hypothetical protein HOLleu_38868 [Holothuria leucospilota]|uniref:MULE transposase domain-containing protein n=1 Tax=Holothuria leucospilota TaxID=206669 RepID=A0A9Q0YMK0_HOLLE|nr:hypothetical protein HOLleu_38868 [Holothuria leucospilota]